MPIVIRKKYRIEMAHQLMSSATPACHETIHGHSYIVEVYMRPVPTVCALGKHDMVVDFGELNAVRSIINQYDHALVMHAGIPTHYKKVLEEFNKKVIYFSCNPTAEAMSMELLRRLREEIAYPGVEVFKVRLHETDTGYAEASV